MMFLSLLFLASKASDNDLKFTRPTFHMILDVGSSGTTPKLYVYEDADDNPDKEPEGNKLQPGLDKFGAKAIASKFDLSKVKLEPPANASATYEHVLTTYLDKVWDDSLRILKDGGREPANLVLIEILCTAGMREFKANKDPTKGGPDASVKYLEAIKAYFQAKVTDDPKMKFNNCKIVNGEDEARGAFSVANKNSLDPTQEIGIIEMGGSSLQIQCEEDTFVSFQNYGARDAIEEYCTFLNKKKFWPTFMGKYTKQNLKCEHVTPEKVKKCFWKYTGDDKTDPFVQIGKLTSTRKWDTGFKTEILKQKRPFYLVGSFMHNAKRFGIDENGNYFGKCEQLVKNEAAELTEEKLKPKVDAYCTTAEIKFQVCFHDALYQLMKEYIDVENTFWRDIEWAKGVSMLEVAGHKQDYGQELPEKVNQPDPEDQETQTQQQEPKKSYKWVLWIIIPLMIVSLALLAWFFFSGEEEVVSQEEEAVLEHEEP